MNRAERRRMERKQGRSVTYDESNPAWIPVQHVHRGILTRDDIERGRWYFPPFTSLVSSGIEYCATLLGVHGPAARNKAVEAVNARIRERYDV